MPPSVIIQLITEVGFPLASQLISAFHSGDVPTTASQWDDLLKLSTYTSTDALTKVGIRIENGKVLPAPSV